MTTYEINPRVKKRWFKENELVYDLIKYSEKEIWDDPSYGNGDGEFRKIKIETVVFSSKNIEEVITTKKNLER